MKKLPGKVRLTGLLRRSRKEGPKPLWAEQWVLGYCRFCQAKGP